MKKWRLLPKLALTGVIRNGTVYFPYLVAGIFSVFTYFVFASIVANDIIKTLPNSAYAWMMLTIGKGLLGLILLPFLYYANSFLLKRRKKEIGLYHMLGLEKKHIGTLMLIENVITYGIVLAGGVVSGVVLSKLLFLLLLRMCGLPVQAEFVFYPAAFKETAVFFLAVYALNFFADLIEIGKSKPVELMSGSKKGEKEPRLLWFYALLGAAALGFGYKIAVTAKIDSMIFINFLLAVVFVVAGTYLLFTSGSVAFLKLIKKRKGIYYQSKNFITISGMLYRMKKSAASLSNICIFSTMVIITLICTVSLYLGMEDIIYFAYPYDSIVHYRDTKVSTDEVEAEIKALEEKYDLEAERIDFFDRLSVSMRKKGNEFGMKEDAFGIENDYSVRFLLLGDYNRLEKKKETLAEDEVLIYCSGADFDYDSLEFLGKKLTAKKEITHFFPEPKAASNIFNASYMIVVKDKAMRDGLVKMWAQASGVEDMAAFLNSETQYVNLLVSGEDAEKEEFLKEFNEWSQSRPGFSQLEDGVAKRAQISSMYGGLLFIGLLFSLIFFMCLILIMYYKQISEGYEDQESFGIMQKVGMSDKEIKSTVHRQILMVFGLPLIAAVLHTWAGMFMVKQLMGTLRLFNAGLIIMCTAGVIGVFLVIYGISYTATARIYYKIVKQL